MKKTLIALMALAGLSQADDITLRYALTTFNTGAPKNSAENPGGTEISRSGYVNWVKGDISGNEDKAVANLSGSGHFFISDNAGIDASSDQALTTTTGFTLVFNGYATNNWADFMSLTVGETQYKFETNDSDKVYIYTPGGDGVVDAAFVGGIARNTWYNYALTANGSSYTFSVWNADGQKVDSYDFTGATGNLTNIYEGAEFSQHWYGGRLDNIGLYEGVLSDADLASLVRSEAAGNGMVQTFSATPEPATATLSLLALAGLAARRKRH